MQALRTVRTPEMGIVSGGGQSALRGALSLTLFAGTLFAGTLSACGNLEIDASVDALESVAIEASAVTAVIASSFVDRMAWIFISPTTPPPRAPLTRKCEGWCAGHPHAALGRSGGGVSRFQ